MKNTEVNRLIDCIEKINEKLRYANKSIETKMDSVSVYAKEVANYLGSTERQACYFSILFSISLCRTEVDLDDIASFLKCPMLSVFKYMSDFDELVKLKVLRKSKVDRRRRRVPDRLDELKFYVPAHIIKSISEGDTKLPSRQKSNMTVYELLDNFANLLQERENSLFTQEELDSEVIALLDEQKQIGYVKSVKGFKLNRADLMLLLFVCCQFTDYDEADLIYFLKTYFSETSDQMIVRKEFLKGDNKLQKLKLVESPTDNFRSDRTLRLSEYAKELFFGEDKELFITNLSRKSDIIVSSEIIPQKLFFNTKEQEQLDILADLLRPENFKSICSRMEASGLRTGFNILLFGPAGTGKSQTCYNLAQQSKRDIFKIAIELTKSKWFGDSERLIAELFDRYSHLTKSSQLTPILLLNECDAILSTRISVQSSVSETQNSMKNLLLERMESLNGILLATSNLTQNIDKAFDRRFLFKIELKQPEMETRILIWKDKIPGLTHDDYQTLSKQFDLSGGQLENITRKLILKEILSGKKLNLSQIIELCEQEFLLKTGDRKPMGFQA